MLEEARDSLSKATRRMEKYANKKRPLEFNVGDMVLLKLTPQIWRKVSRRNAHRGLVARYDGPFEVLQRIGNAAYKLKLPYRLKIHPIFHVSFLKPYHEDLSGEERHKAIRAPPTIHEQFEKEWKGEPLEDATWEKDKTLWQFEDKIKEYWRNRLTRASGSSSGGSTACTEHTDLVNAESGTLCCKIGNRLMVDATPSTNGTRTKKRIILEKNVLGPQFPFGEEEKMRFV
ncbi:hypothetical protein RJ641_020024 [Dillenia turbinata]|uniref:Tf2-1-like SH3-like domain-containing protein n=1 Tax=Dillenia turbinata TaxID=194707 RepID=A0AAN8USR8_9MAGN